MAKQVDPQATPFNDDLTPETSLRLVDEALVAWLGTLTFRGQRPRIVTAWQSRQFAQQHELLNSDDTKQSVTMPYVTLTLTSYTPALDRRVVANIAALGRNPQLWNPSGGREGCGQTPDPSTLDPDGDNRMYKNLAEASTGKALVTSGSSAPYDFDAIASGGDVTLDIVVDGDAQRLTFTAAQFADYTAATVAEIIAAGQPQLVGATLSEAPPGSLTITSDSQGQGSSIQVGGGTANSALNFNTNSVVVQGKDELYILPFPLPYDIAYQIDFFTKTRQDLRFLTSSFMSRFPNLDETFLRICVPGLGNQLLPVLLGRIDDTSDLETGEAERTLRHTATITAKAWIYQVPVRKKTILKADIAIFDATGESLEDGSEFLDFYCDASHYLFSSDGTLQDVDESTSPFTPPDRTIAILNFENGSLTGSGPPGV